MTRLSWKDRDRARAARKTNRTFQPGIENLESRMLMASNLGALASNLRVDAWSVVHAEEIANLKYARPLDATAATATDFGILDRAALANLTNPLVTENPDPGADAKVAPPYEPIVDQGQQNMDALENALKDAGASQQDINHLFGPSDNSAIDLAQTIADSNQQPAADWLSQLPFIGATGGDLKLPTQYRGDPRAAEEDGNTDHGGVQSQSLPDKNNNGTVTINYNDGTVVKVDKQNTVQFNYPDGSRVTVQGQDTSGNVTNPGSMDDFLNKEGNMVQVTATMGGGRWRYRRSSGGHRRSGGRSASGRDRLHSETMVRFGARQCPDLH